jgi:hypothetical protein
MFDRYDTTYQELFTVSIQIPYLLLFLVLAIAVTGWFTSQKTPDKWLWFFFGTAEILVAFLSLRILPIFCNYTLIDLITGIFCVVSLILILGGMLYFRAISQKKT